VLVPLPRLHITGLIHPRTAKSNVGNIRRAVRELTTRPLSAWPFDEALRAVIAAARREAEDVRAIIKARSEAEKLSVERRKAAVALAADYAFDSDRLQFEYDRRCAGSFTTTLAGSSSMRDLYREAWLLSLGRERATLQRSNRNVFHSNARTMH
jgi:hypothetical protein